MDNKGFLKALIIGFIIIAAAVFAASNVMAKVIVTTQIMLQSPAAVALDDAGIIVDPSNTANIATVLVDNFEYYSDSLRNMGWHYFSYYCPWGAGLGLGQVNTILDFEQGSRVLDLYRPMSVFLMNTGYDVYQTYKETVLSNNKPIPGTCSVMILEVMAPQAIEAFDNFSIIVGTKVMASDGTPGVDFSIKFRPIEGPMGHIGLMGALEDDQCIDKDNNIATVSLGRQFQAGGWHPIMEDLAEIVAQFDTGPDGDVGTSDDAALESIIRITIRGKQYRLDNIMFSIPSPSHSIAGNAAVHLFPIGPVYCQLYGQQGDTPQGRWIYAEDLDLGLTSECTADDDLFFPHIAGDADGDGIPTALHINPDGTIENQADITESTLAIYHLDPNGKPNLASPQTPADADLTWIISVGDTLGCSPFDITEEAEINLRGDDTISGDEMNTWPPYLIQRNGVFIENKMETDPNVVQATGTPYVMNLTNPLYVLACALLNSGYQVFPNAVKIVPHLGQVFEDMIVTCRVSDGMAIDKETFPISVVNYPVTNNPPIIMDVGDQTFEVGKTNYYQIVAYDPDLEDMLEGLTYIAIANEKASYQMGPWWPPQKILPNGLFTLKPVYEDTIDCIVTVTDPRGMFAVCEFTIFCKIIDEYPGNWFNHPPVILGELDSPQSIRAGEMFIAREMDFFDPDGDKMYWSCNVGSVGNNGVYTFQSSFPGDYQVQITAYDIRGGATSTEFVIHVKPWWSL